MIWYPDGCKTLEMGGFATTKYLAMGWAWIYDPTLGEEDGRMNDTARKAIAGVDTLGYGLYADLS